MFTVRVEWIGKDGLEVRFCTSYAVAYEWARRAKESGGTEVRVISLRK